MSLVVSRRSSIGNADSMLRPELFPERLVDSLFLIRPNDL